MMSKRLATMAFLTAAQLGLVTTGDVRAQGVPAFISVYNPNPMGGPGYEEAIAAQQWLKSAVGGEDPDFSQLDWWDQIPEPRSVEAIFVGKAILSDPANSAYIWEVVLPNQGAGASVRIALEVSPLDGATFPVVKPGTKLLIQEFLWEPYFWTGGYLDPNLGLYVWHGTLVAK